MLHISTLYKQKNYRIPSPSVGLRLMFFDPAGHPKAQCWFQLMPWTEEDPQVPWSTIHFYAFKQSTVTYEKDFLWPCLWLLLQLKLWRGDRLGRRSVTLWATKRPSRVFASAPPCWKKCLRARTDKRQRRSSWWPWDRETGAFQFGPLHYNALSLS